MARSKTSKAENSAKAQRKARRERRTARADRRNGQGGEGAASPKGQMRQWGEALVFAVVVMVIVRTLFFDLYRIPTPSMEQNLLVGDYLFVSKLNYGTRLPVTLGVPFTQWYLPGVRFPEARLPGFGEPERGDAIVFNYPPETGPVDRKVHYIKRVIGLPGDRLAVEDKVVQVGGEAVPLAEGQQQFWTIHKSDPRYRFSSVRLRDMGVTEISPLSDPKMIRVQATTETIDQIRAWPWVERVEPHVAPRGSGYGSLMFPSGRGYTPDNYGPIDIPAAGATVTLTEENWPVYREAIQRFEDRDARRLGEGQFEIDGQATGKYTFEQDYYFVMGDSRDDSQDSRFWGFVPMDHIVGKAMFTYFSWDTDGSPFLAGQIRFSRIFRGIDQIPE